MNLLNVLNALLNSAHHGSTLLEVPGEVSLEAIKKLKQVYADAFDKSCPLKEARDVANAFKGKLKEMPTIHCCNPRHQEQGNRYAFHKTAKRDGCPGASRRKYR